MTNLTLILAVLVKTLLFSQSILTKQDTLRGTITPERAWWDVKHYEIEIEPIISKQKITGKNTIEFYTLRHGQKMQIDLLSPMEIDSITFAEERTTFNRLGNLYYIEFENELFSDKKYKITIS